MEIPVAKLMNNGYSQEQIVEDTTEEMGKRMRAQLTEWMAADQCCMRPADRQRNAGRRSVLLSDSSNS